MESNGLTIAEQYAMYGVSMSKAYHDRKPGWAMLRGLLRWCSQPEMRPCELCIDDSVITNDGCTHNTFSPGLLVMNHCVNLTRTLPNLIVDPKDPEDCDTHGEDHAPDTLRYAIMGAGTQSDETDHHHSTAYMGVRR